MILNMAIVEREIPQRRPVRLDGAVLRDPVAHDLSCTGSEWNEEYLGLIAS